MDAIEFGKSIGALVRESVTKACAGLIERLVALEKAFADLPAPKDGKSVTVEELQPVVVEAVKEAVAALPPPQDGASVTAADVLPELRDELKALVEALPPPQDGKNADPEEVRTLVDEAVKALPAPKPGEPGTSVTLDDVLPALQDQVKAHLDALPVPQDGKSVTVEEVVLALLPAVEKLLEGFTAKWALEFERRAQDTLQRALERIPEPKAGKDGVDGKNAFELEDFDAYVAIDGQSVNLVFGKGEREIRKTLTFAVPVYQGVYREGTEYRKGHAVTFGGSLWIAQKDAPESKPAEGSKDWVLAVKRGRDGKDAVVRTIQQPATVKVGG